MACFSNERIHFAAQFPLRSVVAARLTEVRPSGVGRGQRIYLEGETISSGPVQLGAALQVNSFGSGDGLKVGGTYLLLLAGQDADPVPWQLADWVEVSPGTAEDAARACRARVMGGYIERKFDP